MRLFLALFLLFAVCNCKLVLKTRNLGRAASSEPSLLTIEYAGSCVDFALMAETITINPVDYNQENLYNVPGSPSSPPSGCLPFFTDETGTPRDYDNLEAHYFCANVGKNRATIQIAEVFNPVIYYYQKDLYGGDLTPGTPITNVASMEVCRDTCRSTSGCVGFAYITPGGSSCNAEGNDLSARGKECWLKSSLQPLRDHPCVISGKIGDEYTVPTGGFILGFRSDRPFRPVSGKAIRRPTCVLAEKYCAATRTAVVTACRSNEINIKKDWILNKDLVYVFPSSNPSPVDCKSSTSCCSYLPDDTVGGSYLSNENAFCVKPTNNETFKLDDLKDKPKDDHKNHKNDENEKNDKDNKKNKDNKKEDDDDDEDKRDPSD